MKGFDLVGIREVVGFFLIATRLSGVFLLSPLLSNRSVPNQLKIPLVLMLSLILMPAVPQTRLEVTNHIQLLIYLFEEFTIGLTLGFVASFIFSTVTVAGEIFGMQIGYGIATILDPTTEQDTGVLTTLYIVLAALFFLYLDGHHIILSSVAKSYQVLPLAGGIDLNAGKSIFPLAQSMLVFAIQIAAPIVVVVTVLNLIFGLITKISPQMNIYFNVGFIVGPLIGVLVLMLSIPLFKVIMFKMTENLSEELLLTIRNLKGA